MPQSARAAWSDLGRWIASHMPFIVPACVASGVLLPQVFSPLERVVPLLFAVMTFQGALGNTAHQVASVLRRPSRLLAVLAVVHVGMPVLAWALASLLFHDPDLVAGIVLEYSVPIGVVSFMWVGMFSGNGSFGLVAVLVSTVISPFSIPATLKLLLGRSVQVDAVGMMLNMIVMIALPALAGMAVNDATRGWGARRLSPALSPACRILLILIITANSTAMSAYVLHPTWERVGVALFILLFASSGFCWGILVARLMGAPLADLVTMSFDCGLRNISSGAVIARQYFPGEVVFPVMCGTIFQQLLASVFGRAVQRLTASERAAQRSRVEDAAARIERR